MASIFTNMGNMLFFYLLWYYGQYYYKLLFKKNRENIKRGNEHLNNYRKKSIKTLEEQKEFLTKKYPHKDFVFKWNMIFSFIWGLGKFLLFFMLFNNLMAYIGIRISIGLAIMCWLIVPLLSSYILSKFKLENSDLVHLMRWK